jgi:formyltetrahydrofolate deformylase
MTSPHNSATLLISCPDRKGIVAEVAQFLYKHNANILHADEHQDTERSIFFLRVEWDLADFALDEKLFQKQFGLLAKKFKMEWNVAYSYDKPKVALFVSKEDHCLADLLYRHKSGELVCDIVFVLSNHTVAKPLADFYGIPFVHIPSEKENKQKNESAVLNLLKQHNVDLIVLARYMQILSGDFLHAFARPVINIHHSFLPAFIGAKPYKQAYERGVKIIGATSHYVTAVLDNGPIIEQDVLRVSHRDSVEDLVQKGKDLERIVLSRAVKWHVENKVLQYGNKTVVFD